MEGRSVVLSDWTGQRDLADLERRWLDRRRLLAARPAIFTARPRGMRCLVPHFVRFGGTP